MPVKRHVWIPSGLKKRRKNDTPIAITPLTILTRILILIRMMPGSQQQERSSEGRLRYPALPPPPKQPTVEVSGVNMAGTSGRNLRFPSLCLANSTFRVSSSPAHPPLLPRSQRLLASALLSHQSKQHQYQPAEYVFLVSSLHSKTNKTSARFPFQQHLITLLLHPPLSAPSLAVVPSKTGIVQIFSPTLPLLLSQPLRT